MSNQRTLLTVGGVVLVLLLVFVSSQSSENGRLRARSVTLQEDAIRRQSELERELSLAQNQGLLFSSRIDELRGELLRQATRVDLNGHATPALPGGLGSGIAELETEQGKITERLVAASEQRSQIAASIKALEDRIDEMKARGGVSAGEVEKLIAAGAESSNAGLAVLAAAVDKIAALIESLETSTDDHSKIVTQSLQRLQNEVTALSVAATDRDTRLGQLEETQLRGSSSPKVSEDPEPANVVEVRVRVVDLGKGVLVLDGGSADGVVEDQVLELRRGREILGQVRVRRVQADIAGAQITQRTPGAEIREGDLAVLLTNPVSTPSPAPQSKSEAKAPPLTKTDRATPKTPPPPPPGS